MQMPRNRHGFWILFLVLLSLSLSLSPLAARYPAEPAPAPPPPPPPAPAAPSPPPKVVFTLKDRHGHNVPTRTDSAHTGGGVTDVAQPREDTLVITMTGVVTAGPHPTKATAASLDFDLVQEFAINFVDPKLTRARLTLEAQVIGLLRGDKHGGTASVGPCATAIGHGETCILSLLIDGHSVSGDENLAINDRKGPVNVLVGPTTYRLKQTFRINAEHVRSICGKASAAEFAPDPVLNPTWISVTDPFRNANKKEFGFRVTLHVEPE